jgi:hypothetical protein
MKKLFIAAIAVLSFATANAQYVAEKGDFQASVEFRPFNNGGQDMFNTVGFNAAYFVSDKDAIRARLNFGLKSREMMGAENYVKFGIAAGYERHFKTLDRVDVFGGGQVSFDMNSPKYFATKTDGSLKKLKSGNETTFGVAAFTGVNFYVYKKLYVGAEIQFAFETTSYGKPESYNAAKDEVTTPSDKPKSKVELAFKAIPALKLGWTF